MPTSTASGESLPRMLPASVANRASASGGEALMVRGGVEEALEDDRGRKRVEIRLARGASAGFAKARLGFRRGERLIDEHDGKLEALAQPPREFLGEAGGLVRRIVRV